jgi:glycosyltransferase involved in cell wall biosynthesis
VFCLKKSFSKKDDKILIISNMYPSKKDPIYGNFVQEQNDFLQKNGFNTLVSKITERDGSPIQKINKYIKLFSDSFIKALRPDVKIIHYHYEYPTALFAPFFKYILRKKVFITVHGPRVLEHTGWKKSLIKTFFNASDYVVCVSNYLKTELQDTYNLDKNKVLSIHCGVDTQKFFPVNKSDVRKELNLNNEKIIILYLGRIHEEKGMDYYSEVIPELIDKNKDLYFLFVGNGPHTHFFDNLREQFPDNFEYRTGVSKEEVPKYFNAADLFVFPTKMETFGLVALEALACNTLVVAARVGGVPEIIENKNRGFLFENENKLELKEMINLCLNIDVLSREEIIKNGQLFVHQNTIEQQTKSLISFYEKV